MQRVVALSSVPVLSRPTGRESSLLRVPRVAAQRHIRLGSTVRSASRFKEKQEGEKGGLSTKWKRE